MKKISLLLLLTGLALTNTFAQGTGGFFNQQSSKIKLMLAQIAGYETFLHSLKSGYRITENGLNTPRNDFCCCHCTHFLVKKLDLWQSQAKILLTVLLTVSLYLCVFWWSKMDFSKIKNRVFDHLKPLFTFPKQVHNPKVGSSILLPATLIVKQLQRSCNCFYFLHVHSKCKNSSFTDEPAVLIWFEMNSKLPVPDKLYSERLSFKMKKP